MEKHKPHITRLPVIAFPDYDITDTEVAVSIALFHSAIDSATLTPTDTERIKSVHAKGAVWAAMSLIRNTDLAERGVGIYFHVEDTVYDTVMEVFAAFKVPDKFIRKMHIEIPALPNEIKHPHYGKKFMCLEDTIDTARWLIADSDAFVCTLGDKLYWYDQLKVFEKPSAIKSFMGDYKGDQFRIWVHGVCLAAGLPFFHDEDLFGQELRCFYTLEHWIENKRPINPGKDASRPVISTQLFMLPVKHALTAHLKKFYKTCYQDEFLIALWQASHQEVSDLRKKLGSFHFYNYETEFIERDKALDQEGYLAHIVPDDHGPEQKDVDAYYKDFYKALTFHDPPSPQTDTASISDKLVSTRSDKQHPKGHQYGKFYDMLFESMVFRKKKPLRVLEIGVSLFGQGSIEAFQASELVEQIVGLDLMTYVGKLNEKSTFHKRNAYKPETLAFLKAEYPDGFDIIIDDATHDPADQAYFLENYVELLSTDGKLICEDVHDEDFFREMCEIGGCYGIDGTANAAIRVQHMERLLIKDRPRVLPSETAAISGVAEFNVYTPPVRKTFHVLEVPYATGKEDFACAFVQRIFKWCRAMKNLGHTIIYYGHANSTVDCDEHVPVYDNKILEETYGSADYFVVPEHDMNDAAFKAYAKNTEPEIRKRAQADDFVLAFYGLGHLALCEAIADLPVHIVEPSIGYPDAFSENRVYQSSAKMHFERGKADVNYFIAENYPDCEWNKFVTSLYNRMQYTVPDRNSVVIPNFIDLDHFPYQEQKEDYICFVGRINICKGLHDVFQLAKYTNTKLIAAGVGRLEQCGLEIPPQLEFVGVADIKTRGEIFGGAKAHVCPSIYIEPWLGTGPEANGCGTPNITTNWGAPMDWCKDGVTGWRAQNFDHLVWALENVDKIDPKVCRHQALQYSKERVSLMYHEYFDILLQNKRGGRWSINPERKRLDWLYKDMTETEINNAITEIQQQMPNASASNNPKV